MSVMLSCFHRVSRSDGQLASLLVVNDGARQLWTMNMFCWVAEFQFIVELNTVHDVIAYERQND